MSRCPPSSTRNAGNLWLGDALNTLNPRELRIIRERRLAEDGATLESLGTALGISKERVRQIENRALEKLRAVLTSQTPENRQSL